MQTQPYITIQPFTDGYTYFNAYGDGASEGGFAFRGNDAGTNIMRLQPNGKVGIGTSTPAYKLDVRVADSSFPLNIHTVNGYIRIGDQNSSYAHFYTDRTTFYFNKQVQCVGGCVTYSDRNLKKEFLDVTNGLDKIQKLQGVTFKWKDTSLGTARHMGLVAQDVELVAPELVESTPHGKSMDYDGMSALFVESIKELKAENDNLRHTLETENAWFRKELKDLKAAIGQ